MFGLKAPGWLICADLFSDSAGRCIGLVLMQRLVFSDSGSLTGLILMQFLNLAPAIFTGPFAGILIDRTRPKFILVWVNAIRLMLVFCLLMKTGSATVFIIYLGYLVMTNSFAIGISSWVPMLMPGNRILTFNAKNESIALLGAAITPLFISELIARSGTISALIVAALMLILSLAAVCAIPFKSIPAIHHFSAAKIDLGGHGALSDHARQAVFRFSYEYLILALAIFMGMVIAVGLPVLHKQIFKGDILLWGIFMSGFQAGSASASLFLCKGDLNLSKKAFSLWALNLTCLLPAMMGLWKNSRAIMLLMFLFGSSSTFINLLAVSAIQRHSGRADSGRSMSILKAYQGICMLTAVSFSSAIIYFFPPRVLFNFGSLIGCAGLAFALRFSNGGKKKREVE